MTCREFAAFIIDDLAAELPADSRARSERHLTRCPHCPESLRQYQITVVASQAAFDDLDAPVPETVPEELVAAIQSRPRFLTCRLPDSRHRALVWRLEP